MIKREPYKLEPYEINYETRYRVISLETGRLIDDAQGYGYKTREKARQGYYFLSKQKYVTDREYKDKRKAVNKWLQLNNDFTKELSNCATRIHKGLAGNIKFDVAMVGKLLQYHNIKTEYTPAEIFAVFLNGDF